ncbi:MAG: amidase domain-containing protein [Peptostreptococcales bacterium]
MSNLKQISYNREDVVRYAHTWAFGRNPRYYDFKGIGGDCTNFASQCLFAGAKVMNYTPTLGWYYNHLNDRAPAWTSVNYFHQFLINNKGVGPYGSEVAINQIEEGDFIQLMISKAVFQHTLIVVSVGKNPHPNNILVAAHTFDADNRPLSTYAVNGIRFIHIDGVRR